MLKAFLVCLRKIFKNFLFCSSLTSGHKLCHESLYTIFFDSHEKRDFIYEMGEKIFIPRDKTGNKVFLFQLFFNDDFESVLIDLNYAWEKLKIFFTFVVIVCFYVDDRFSKTGNNKINWKYQQQPLATCQKKVSFCYNQVSFI